MCATMVCYTALDSSAKWLGFSLPVWQIVWVRYLGATVLAVGFANPFANPRLLHSERLGLQLMRALFLLGSTILSFVAVRYLQLSETTSINFAMPLAVALAAGPLLGEWVGPRRLLAILAGFLGVLVVVRPDAGTVHPAMLLCLANVILGAGYNMLTRVVAQRDRASTTLIYSTIGGTILLAPVMPFVWVWPQTATVWGVVLLIGAVGSLGHYLVILAHARAPASILAPFSYTQLLWMVISGFVVFGDVPHASTIVGAAVVISSGLYLWYRERSERAA